MTHITIASEILSYVEPTKSNTLYSYSPSKDWISRDTPKPNKKLNNWPEYIPETAVAELPVLAKWDIVKKST